MYRFILLLALLGTSYGFRGWFDHNHEHGEGHYHEHDHGDWDDQSDEHGFGDWGGHDAEDQDDKHGFGDWGGYDTDDDEDGEHGNGDWDSHGTNNDQDDEQGFGDSDSHGDDHDENNSRGFGDWENQVHDSDNEVTDSPNDYHDDSHNNYEDSFSKLSSEVIKTDRYVEHICKNHRTSIVQEVPGNSTYKIVYTVPSSNVDNIKIKIKHRVIYMNAQQLGVQNPQTLVDLRILPNMLKISEASWEYMNNIVTVSIPYDTPFGSVTNCFEVNEDVITVPANSGIVYK